MVRDDLVAGSYLSKTCGKLPSDISEMNLCVCKGPGVATEAAWGGEAEWAEPGR